MICNWLTRETRTNSLHLSTDSARESVISRSWDQPIEFQDHQISPCCLVPETMLACGVQSLPLTMNVSSESVPERAHEASALSE